jgi:hypothetical protein
VELELSFLIVSLDLIGGGVYPGRGMGKSPEWNENKEVNRYPWGERVWK